jgi:hypothetical protein
MSNRRSTRTLLASGALACAMVVSTAVHASGVAPADATALQKKEALAHFTTGKEAAEAKEWEKAQSELRASLEIVDSPNGRLVLARALRDSGEVGSAWAEYGRTIEVATRFAGTDPRYTQTAEAAKTERAELDPKLAFVVVSVAHAPADATLKVGGRVIPSEEWSAPIVASPGTVDVVVADAAGKELARKTVAAAIGDKTPVALDTQPSSAAAAPPPTATSSDDVPPKDKPDAEDSKGERPSTPGGRAGLRSYAYVAGGAGVAGLIVFGIFGAMEKSTYSGLQSACPGNVCPPDKASDISSGKTQQLVANVGLGVGIAGVAAGATLFLLSLGGSSSTTAPQAASTSLVVSPGFIGLRGAL